MVRRLLIGVTVVAMSLAEVYAKEPPIDWYPEEYGKMTAQDWPRMKQTLEKVLKSDNIDELRVSELNRQARYMLSMLASIQWNETQKKEVVAYLKHFVESVLQGKGYIKNVHEVDFSNVRPMSRSDPIYLPERAIWAMLSVDVEAGCDTIEHLWQVFIRYPENVYYREIRLSILRFLEARHKSSRIFACLERIKSLSGDKLKPDESKRIKRFFLKQKLLEIGDQSKAWEYLWDRSKTNTLAETITSNQGWIWYHNILHMKEVYHELDISVPMAIASKSLSPHKKYVFLYCACGLMNTKLSLSPTGAHRKLIERLINEVEAFYKEVGQEITRHQESRDYLKLAFDSIKAKLEEPQVIQKHEDQVHVQKEDEGAERRLPTLVYILVAATIAAFIVSLMLVLKKKVMFGILLATCVVVVCVLTVQKLATRKDNADIASSGESVEERPTLSRPEERGEDLSVLETAEVVKRLAESKDKIESRKAAKVLGDRSIAGKLDLSSEEEQTIENVVSGYFEQGKSANVNERVEARQQVERLWHVAAPTLLENLNSKDPTIAEMAIKSLILMRNESIIKALVQKAESAKDEYTRAMANFALKKMKEQRKSLIPERECLDEEQSRILYDRLVAPALRNLEEEVNP